MSPNPIRSTLLLVTVLALLSPAMSTWSPWRRSALNGLGQNKRSVEEADDSFPCAGVIITEFMYDPTDDNGGDSKGEWVEILNDSCEAMDLTGWQIGDSAARATISALDGNGMTLQAGEYALIIGSESTVLDTYSIPPSTRIFVSSNAVIGNGLNDNSGDTVFLLDTNGNASDKVTYVVGAACTGGSTSRGSGAAKGGKSMERRDPLGPSDCSNFSPSFADGGSPGSENPNWTGTEPTQPCTCATQPIRPCESVIITEIMFDPAGRDFGLEWVEIRNNGVDDVNLDGWSFADLNGSDLLSANGDSFVLSAGEYAIIIESDRPSNAVAFPVGTRTFFGGKILGNGLKNTGDTLFIVNEIGSVVDTVTYIDKARPGYTLERIDSSQGFEANFQESAEVGGTPGQGTPGIENAEPACTAQCKPKNLNVCVAIDRSGSICDIKTCRGVPSCGCEDFDKGLDFAIDFINGTDALPENNDFAVVAFASNAYVKTPVASAQVAIETVANLRYTSGYTNTSQALQFCSQELDKGDSDAVRAIVMITDGTPTRPYTPGSKKFEEAREEATKQANAAKDEDGTTIITILVESPSNSAEYLKTLTSEGYFMSVNKPEDLDRVSESLLDLIQCA